MKRQLTCIICPRGCDITLEYEGKRFINAEGYACKRGLEYAMSECSSPMRTLTTTVSVEGGGVIPVKTDRAVPKELLLECMREINAMHVKKDIAFGEVIIKDILGTGANVVIAGKI